MYQRLVVLDSTKEKSEQATEVNGEEYIASISIFVFIFVAVVLVAIHIKSFYISCLFHTAKAHL